ncbi:hypothetical protein JCM10213_004779 [Rhodosporidiobolus nylandii]
MPPRQWGPPPSSSLSRQQATQPRQQPPTSQDGELTPHALAQLWKKHGGFDALRRQLVQDFLASPDKDALLARLDAVLPPLLAGSPALQRQARKDRPAYVLGELERREVLKPEKERVEGRLRADKGKGKRVERELRNALRRSRGESGEEEAGSDEEEEKEEVVKKEPEAEEATPAPAPVIPSPSPAAPTPAPAPPSALPGPSPLPPADAALEVPPAVSPPAPPADNASSMSRDPPAPVETVAPAVVAEQPEEAKPQQDDVEMADAPTGTAVDDVADNVKEEPMAA